MSLSLTQTWALKVLKYIWPDLKSELEKIVKKTDNPIDDWIVMALDKLLK